MEKEKKRENDSIKFNDEMHERHERHERHELPFREMAKSGTITVDSHLSIQCYGIL